MTSINNWVMLLALTVMINGCATPVPSEPDKDQFGHPIYKKYNPFQGRDKNVVKTVNAQYEPTYVSVHGEWLRLRWHTDGRYEKREVWIPRSSIIAIENRP